jgi:hypothetical protein
MKFFLVSFIPSDKGMFLVAIIDVQTNFISLQPQLEIKLNGFKPAELKHLAALRAFKQNFMFG